MKEDLVRIPSYGGGRVSVEGLTADEVDLIRGSLLAGHNWIRRDKDGRLEKVPSYEKPPTPVPDEVIGPFWSPLPPGTTAQHKMALDGKVDDYSSPSIQIQSLCGYNYTPKLYELEAARLESYGFTCLRSRRNENSGEYWEMWYLPGLWAAKSELKEAIETSPRRSGASQQAEPPSEMAKLGRALEFLRYHASFGTLDVSVQRLAMTIDD